MAVNKKIEKSRQSALPKMSYMALSDRIAFMEAVFNPPLPTLAAIKAAKRYKRIFVLP